MNAKNEPTTFESVVGKYILVGLDHFSAEEKLLRQEQVHGRIIEANMTKGIVVQKSDGSTFSIPPSIECLARAEPGIYTLRSTGEEIEDPDFTITFKLHPRDDS